ncbi:MAG: hypothetical protein J6A30_02920 [Ruminococcus sp.]|nr:hypothetical protein [Ruminococcus sp.]
MKKRFCLKTVALATVLLLTGCVSSENMDNSENSVTTTPCILSETELVTEAEISQTFANDKGIGNSDPQQSIYYVDYTISNDEANKFIENNDSLSYKTGLIIYNEYLKYKNGEYEDWWVNNEEAPHLCVCAVVLDMNYDGKYELFLKKYKNSVYCYNALFDINSGDVLYSSSDDLTAIYYDNSKYYIETEQSNFRRILISMENNSESNYDYEQVNSDYLHIGNGISTTIYEYKTNVLHPYQDGSWCRKFDCHEGFTYYYGEYENQLEELLLDFEHQVENFKKLGDFEHLAMQKQVYDHLFVIQISQNELQDFNSLLVALEVVDALEP